MTGRRIPGDIVNRVRANGHAPEIEDVCAADVTTKPVEWSWHGRIPKGKVTMFDGDPDAVTLFGSSAGGDAIAHLMIADGAAGLFRRAVLQSPPLGIARGRAAMAVATLTMLSSASE